MKLTIHPEEFQILLKLKEQHPEKSVTTLLNKLIRDSQEEDYITCTKAQYLLK